MHRRFAKTLHVTHAARFCSQRAASIPHRTAKFSTWPHWNSSLNDKCDCENRGEYNPADSSFPLHHAARTKCDDDKEQNTWLIQRYPKRKGPTRAAHDAPGL